NSSWNMRRWSCTTTSRVTARSMRGVAGRCSTISIASTIRPRRCGAWASCALLTSATSSPNSTARTEFSLASTNARRAGALQHMRLSLYVVLGLGALALGVVLLGWLAERKMDRKAAADSTSNIAQAHAVGVALVLGTAPIGPEGGPNRYLVYRLDAAAELWKAGKVKYLLVSGNRDGGYDEPTAMREGLMKRGVPADAIYRDFAGYRTRDSVLRARDIFGQREILVV